MMSSIKFIAGLLLTLLLILAVLTSSVAFFEIVFHEQQPLGAVLIATIICAFIFLFGVRKSYIYAFEKPELSRSPLVSGNESPEAFKVNFCNDFTLSYKDQEGVLKFAFELGAQPQSLCVDPNPVNTELSRLPDSATSSARTEEALSKVIEYLHTRKYKVEIF